MMWTRIGMIAVLFTLMVMGSTAQDTNNGRFCVRLFVDENGNAAQETGEAPITQGIGADLRARNSEVILASQLMQDAPNRRAGEICFTELQLGQYEISVNSAVYNIPTGDDTVFTELSETQPVIIASYGVPPAPVALAEIDADDDVDREEVLERSLIAGAGSLIAMALTAFIGIIIYALFLRRGGDVEPAYPVGSPPPPPPDNQFRRPTDTGEYDYNYRPPNQE